MGQQTEKEEETTEEIFEVITSENFPKLMTDIKSHIQEGQRTPSQINTRKNKQKTYIQACHIQIAKN